jgi:hypothetical protein
LAVPAAPESAISREFNAMRIGPPFAFTPKEAETVINSVSNNTIPALTDPVAASAKGAGFEQQLLSLISETIQRMGMDRSQFDIQVTYTGETRLSASQATVGLPAPATVMASPLVQAPSAERLLADHPSASADYRASITNLGYNAAQYADPLTAQWLADLLGGAVTHTQSAGPGGPPPQALISWGPGKEMCAGLLAQRIDDAKRMGISETCLEMTIRNEMASIGVTPPSGTLPMAV